MKEWVFHGKVDITYIKKPASLPSDVLVVAFPGVNGANTGNYGYLLTLGEFNVNRLLIKYGEEEEEKHYGECRLTYLNREPVFEDAIVFLIKKTCEETGSKRVIVIGSSMGGFDALYYGLKYDWDIISGAPPWSWYERSLIHIAGGTDEECQNWADNILTEVVKNAGERGREGKSIFLTWGKGEKNWLSPLHAPKLLKQLDDAGIKYSYELSDFQSHFAIHKMFKNILKTRLSFLLGLTDENNLKSKTDETAIAELIEKKTESLLPFTETLKTASLNTDLKCRAQYPDYDNNTALRNFAYLTQSYFWFTDFDEPIYAESPDNYRIIFSPDENPDAMSFSFQQTILNHYNHSGNINALIWCGNNLRYYFENNRFEKPFEDPQDVWQKTLIRLHYVLNYICCVSEIDANDKIYNDIAAIRNEIIRDFQDLLSIFIMLDDSYGSYERINTILHMAALFANDKDFSEKALRTGMFLANKLTDYYFDKNGVCIYQQARYQHRLYVKIKEILCFAEANFEPFGLISSLRRKFDKIKEISSLLLAPNGVCPALGHSVYRTYPDEEQKTGIFASPESNLAVFSTDDTYITVQSGTSIHARIKHCDLLSFTFQYDKQPIIYDSEGGLGQLADFAQSAIAHSAFIMDDSDYVTPTFPEWKSMHRVDINEDNVVVRMSHKLFVDIGLRRFLIWLKPNVIILADRAYIINTTDIKHKFTQNFILQDTPVNITDDGNVTGKIGTVNFSITQYRPRYRLRTYRGTKFATDKAVLPDEEMRGSLITGYTKTRQGLCLAYNKFSKYASFLTAIEAHSSNEALRKQEVSVKGLKIEGKDLIITLDEGEKIIRIF